MERVGCQDTCGAPTSHDYDDYGIGEGEGEFRTIIFWGKGVDTKVVIVELNGCNFRIVITTSSVQQEWLVPSYSPLL